MRVRNAGVISSLWLTAACAAPAAKPFTSSPGSSDVRTAAALFLQGVENARREDFSRAEQYFAAALARGYPEAPAVRWLVRVCLASARLRTALGYVEPYLERHPDEPALLDLVAAVRLSLDDAKGARAVLEHAVELAPEEALPRYLLAVTLRDGFDDPDAAAREIAVYLRLAPAGPHAAEARSFLGTRLRFKTCATRVRTEPTSRAEACIGSRSRSPTDAPLTARAADPAPR